MKEQLINVLGHILPFEPVLFERIVSHFHPKNVKRNARLLQAGEVCKEFYFVRKGCIRTYFIESSGHERTRYVMTDNWIGTALTSFIAQKPSFEYVEALEDTELLYISHDDFYRLNKEMDQWKIFYQKILEMAYSFQNRKIESLVTLSAKERYEQLLKERPELIQKLSNKVLASYLDMSPETLSRIKGS